MALQKETSSNVALSVPTFTPPAPNEPTMPYPVGPESISNPLGSILQGLVQGADIGHKLTLQALDMPNAKKRAELIGDTIDSAKEHLQKFRNGEYDPGQGALSWDGSGNPSINLANAKDPLMRNIQLAQGSQGLQQGEQQIIGAKVANLQGVAGLQGSQIDNATKAAQLQYLPYKYQTKGMQYSGEVPSPVNGVPSTPLADAAAKVVGAPSPSVMPPGGQGQAQPQSQTQKSIIPPWPAGEGANYYNKNVAGKADNKPLADHSIWDPNTGTYSVVLKDKDNTTVNLSPEVMAAQPGHWTPPPSKDSNNQNQSKYKLTDPNAPSWSDVAPTGSGASDEDFAVLDAAQSNPSTGQGQSPSVQPPQNGAAMPTQAPTTQPVWQPGQSLAQPADQSGAAPPRIATAGFGVYGNPKKAKNPDGSDAKTANGQQIFEDMPNHRILIADDTDPLVQTRISLLDGDKYQVHKDAGEGIQKMKEYALDHNLQYTSPDGRKIGPLEMTPPQLSEVVSNDHDSRLPPSKLEGQDQKQLSGLSEAINQAQELKASSQKLTADQRGGFSAFWNQFKDTPVGNMAKLKVDPDYMDFKTKVDQFKDTMRTARDEKRVNEAEYNSVMAYIGDPVKNAQSFPQRLDSATTVLQRRYLDTANTAQSNNTKLPPQLLTLKNNLTHVLYNKQQTTEQLANQNGQEGQGAATPSATPTPQPSAASGQAAPSTPAPASVNATVKNPVDIRNYQQSGYKSANQWLNSLPHGTPFIGVDGRPGVK